MRSILLMSGLALITLAACQPDAPGVDTGASPSPPPASTQSPPTSPAPATASLPGSSAAKPPAGHWQCGEVLLDARLEGESMHLDFSGRTLALPHAESLTGVRYADRAGNAFAPQGDGARLILAGDEARDCNRSEHVSPWIEAAARGIRFRAVGSEPGWFVEVGKGEAPTLRATLDYGDRRIEVDRTQAKGIDYIGTAADGTRVALRIKREPCHDGMSGEAFEASAQLAVGDSTYRGCGAFLGD